MEIPVYTREDYIMLLLIKVSDVFSSISYHLAGNIIVVIPPLRVIGHWKSR